MSTTWISNGQDIGGSGAYVVGTQGVQFIHDNFAQVGDTITIPTGTFTWSTGLNITKAIRIAGPATSGATNIVSNSNGILISLTPSAAGYVTLAWITFTVAAAITARTGKFITVQYNPGALACLIHDCSFKSVAQLLNHINIQQNGTVVWNCSFDGGGTPSDTGNGLISIDGCIQFKNPGTDVWKTQDSMGMSGDPNGTLDTYVEDCTFANAYTEALDFDDGSRTVIRHCTFTDAAIASHGYDSSPWGNRHWEIYNNTFNFPHLAGSGNVPHPPNVSAYLTLRGGTGVVTGNTFQPVGSSFWGAKSCLNWLSDGVTQGGIGKCYTVYPAARQVGQGWNGGSGTYAQAPELGSGYFTDPAYVWNNNMDNTYNAGSFTQGWIDNTGCSGGYTSAQFIQSGRDFFLNAGAKPGWAAYTYPHPLRGAVPTQPPNQPPTQMQNPPKLRGYALHMPHSAADNFTKWGRAWTSYFDHYPVDQTDIAFRPNRPYINSYIDHFSRPGDTRDV